MRIGLVNDMLMAVEALRRVVTAAEHRVAWIARDGAEAVRKCAADTPDLVLMDLYMPVMDGVEATRRIMAESPCAVLVVTATVRGHAAKVFEAMGVGALDAVRTPSLGPDGQAVGAVELLAKIASISRLIRPGTGTFAAATPAPPSRASLALPPLIAIGASSGGPKALLDLLVTLPAGFPAAIVIIQHVNARFAPGMAEWLGKHTAIRVGLAEAGGRPEAGAALMPASDDNLILRPDLTFAITPEPVDCPYRPSVDAFFQSVARHWPAKGVGVLLTGMGRDGAQGLLALRQAGWLTIAQDAASSVVYGMPKAAAELGAAVEIMPLHHIGPALMRRMSEEPTAVSGVRAVRPSAV